MSTAAMLPGQVQIPVIDISGAYSEPQVAYQLVHAATVHGFVYIRSLGKDIPVKDIDHMFDLSRTFFASPIEEKEKVMISEDNRGWVAMHSETLDSKTQRIGDFKEAFNFGEFSSAGAARQPLPSSLAPHESSISAFFTQCHALCLRLLTLFGAGLHISPSSAGGSSWFASRHNPLLGPSGCTLRLLYYPLIPPSVAKDLLPGIDIRAGAHSDYGSITLLFQRPGQPGLEILAPSGTWSPVPVHPPGTEDDPTPPILVNIGDLFSYWTKGLFRSTVHRVVFPKEGGGQDRYSIAYFCHPVNSTVLEEVPSEMVRARTTNRSGAESGSAGNEKRITAQEHLLERLKATYLSLDWDNAKQKGDQDVE